VLQNSVSNGMVAVEAAVRVFDVTSWTSYFGMTGGQKFAAKDGTDSPFPDLVSSAFDTAGVQGGTSTACATNFITNCTTNQFGSLIPISFGLSGSLDVVAGRIYLVDLLLSTYTFGGLGFRAADFDDTAAFRFTDLGGLNFESASGQFLSQQVPEPATGLIFGAGLAAVGLVRRLRHRASG
jgi:hypothetical protein